jgi:predicted nuclease of predicted toxin-antitoxin system
VRFFLDHNVPVSVRRMLLEQGHECWTASEAGLATEGRDDNLSVYADSKRAALVTFDREFSGRRRDNPIGRHVWLRCTPPAAAAVLRDHLHEVLELLHREHVTIEVNDRGVRATSKASAE